MAALCLGAARVATAAAASGPTAGPISASGRLADLLPSAITSCKLPQAEDTPVVRQSRYVELQDHVKLAVDIFTKAAHPPDGKMPTLFTATRYGRAQRDAPISEAQRRWVAAGYVVVNADVRGTGASFGQWYIPYTHQEARDLGYLANWIARQPWSNGAVVMTGNSYPGTTPLLAAAYGAPALKAIAPRFSDFDMYTDLLWPGGVVAEDLIVGWGKLVHHMDLNEPDDESDSSWKGVRPVDGADGEASLAAAVADHKLNPWSFDQAAFEVKFKDQPSPHMHGMTIDGGDVYTLDEEIARSGIPIFGWGSWLDSGIAQGLLSRFNTLANPQLTIIGPWTHGAAANANVYDLAAPLDPPRAVQDEWIYCFLDGHAKISRPRSFDHRLVYFTMGENRWKSTDVWPVRGTHPRRYYLDFNGTLSPRSPGSAGLDDYRVDFEASTGAANRWATQTGAPKIDYGDRSKADARLLTYTSAPLSDSMEITGQALVTLNVISNREDGNFIVYLEDVAPDGRVTYLAEGALRGLQRKLSKQAGPYKTTYPYRSFSIKDAEPLVPGRMATLIFQLQATSVRLEAGHRLRFALAGADQGTFFPVPADRRNVLLKVSRGGSQPSFIDVPQVR
jgi:hypothetical protein